MDKYRVIVLREGTDQDETLFEMAGSVALILGVVPSVLGTVLTTDEERPAGPGEQSAQPATPAAAASLADRVFDSAAAALPAQNGRPLGLPAPTTKRTRRTKAQIAADEAAVAAGFRDAAHRTEVESQQQVAAGVAASPAPADYVPPAGDAFVAASVPPPGPSPAAPAPVPAGPDGQPWNPFTQ